MGGKVGLGFLLVQERYPSKEPGGGGRGWKAIFHFVQRTAAPVARSGAPNLSLRRFQRIAIDLCS